MNPARRKLIEELIRVGRLIDPVLNSDNFKNQDSSTYGENTELKVDVPPESTESEAVLSKEDVSEDSEEIIENKNKDDHQKEEVVEQIEANSDFETNSEIEAAADTKKSETKEKPELEAEVESDAS